MRREVLPHVPWVIALLAAAMLFAAEPPAAKIPVVVELFTSQGCSSCPSADRLLSRLGEHGAAGGVEVIPLSFHVDYWNYIGWTDPFSSKAWSDRQRHYARAMRLDTIYTPQMVIQGTADVVGSNADSVRREIDRARGRGAAVAVDVRLTRASDAMLRAHLETRVGRAIRGDRLDLVVALFEKRLVTPVSRGENAARTLENDYVVRALHQAFEIDRHPGSAQRATLDFELDPTWKLADLGVAAFAQDPTTLRIHGATARTLEP